jgi:O-antigen ligase
MRLVVDEVGAYYSEGEIETSVGARLYMWDGAYRIFIEDPIIGVGTGGYMIEMAKHSEFPVAPDHPHNSFLYLASCFGLVGLSVFLWVLIVLMTKGWRARDSVPGFAVLAFSLVLIIGSLTDTQILSLATGTMFALFTGMSDNEGEVSNEHDNH